MAEPDTTLKDKIRALVDACDEAHAITGVAIAAQLLTGYAAVHYHLGRMVSDGEIERSIGKPWHYWGKRRSLRHPVVSTRGTDTPAPGAVAIRPVSVREPVGPLPAPKQIAIPVLTDVPWRDDHKDRLPAEAAFHIDGEGRIGIEHGADSLSLDPLNTLRLRRFLNGVGPLLDLLEHDARAA